MNRDEFWREYDRKSQQNERIVTVCLVLMGLALLIIVGANIAAAVMGQVPPGL